MSDDSARKAILARRAYFVAAALASAGLGATACGGETGSSSRRDAASDVEPQPCLKISPSDAGADAEPRPCLDIAPDATPPDAEPSD